MKVYKKIQEKTKKLITKVVKNPKGKIINVTKLTYEEAQRELKKVFEGA